MKPPLFVSIQDMVHLRARLLLYYPLLTKLYPDHLATLISIDRALKSAAHLWLLDVVNRFMQTVHATVLLGEQALPRASEEDIVHAFSHYMEQTYQLFDRLPLAPELTALLQERQSVQACFERFGDYMLHHLDYIDALAHDPESAMAELQALQKNDMLH